MASPFEEAMAQGEAQQAENKRMAMQFAMQLFMRNTPAPISPYEAANLAQQEKYHQESLTQGLQQQGIENQGKYVDALATGKVTPSLLPTDIPGQPQPFYGHNVNIVPPEQQPGHVGVDFSKLGIPGMEGRGVVPTPVGDLTQVASLFAKPQAQEDLKGQKDAIKGWLTKSWDKKDDTLPMYLNGIDMATTPALLETAKQQALTYHTEKSPSARSASMQDKINQALSEHRATHAMDLSMDQEDTDRTADSIYKTMIGLGLPPEMMFKGMKAGDRLRETVDFWMRTNDAAKAAGKPVPYPLPTYLSAKAQTAMGEIETSSQIAKEVQNFFQTTPDPLHPGHVLAENNTPFNQLPNSVKYKFGLADDRSSVISKMLVLQKVAAGRIAKGIGVSTEKIETGLEIHTPDPFKDSPSLSMQKAGNIAHYIDIQRANTMKYGNKWGILRATGDPNEGPDTETKNSLDVVKGMK